MTHSEIKFQMRQLIATIHSLIGMLSDLRYETNCSANQIDAIRKLYNSAGQCFDELYKDVKR